jgi:hypothetical protein
MKRALVLVVALAVGGATYGAQALATVATQQLHGHLRSQARTSGCTSPVGICTAGRLDGTINGDFVFTMSDHPSSSTPGVFFYNGEIVVSTSRGELRCSDAGVYSFADPSGPNVELCTITSGTGEWAGATGSIRLHGTFTFAAGGDAHYDGDISR